MAVVWQFADKTFLWSSIVRIVVLWERLMRTLIGGGICIMLEWNEKGLSSLFSRCRWLEITCIVPLQSIRKNRRKRMVCYPFARLITFISLVAIVNHISYLTRIFRWNINGYYCRNYLHTYMWNATVWGCLFSKGCKEMNAWKYCNKFHFGFSISKQ